LGSFAENPVERRRKYGIRRKLALKVRLPVVDLFVVAAQGCASNRGGRGGEAMFIEWSPAFDIEVPRIDRQHRRLAELVNEFHAACGKGRVPGVVFTVLNGLVRYVEEHFRSEEALMTEVRYPELLRHRREHERLTLEIFALNEKLEAGDVEISQETMAFLKRWLLDHILQSDRKLGEYVQERGIPPLWLHDEP
jgi:hemerythrin